jgi:DNA-binding MarR family transcriptional regulator
VGAQEVDYKLHGFMRYHRRVMQRFFSDCGMFNGHPFMLFLIRREPGITPAEIARRMEITPASATVSLKRMEAAGLLTRTADEQDRRVVHLALTPEGERLDDRCRAEKDRIVEATFRDFTAEELAVLDRLLDRMYDNLKEAEQA